MRADSTADWEARVRVETAVMGLARNVDRGVGLSDSTFKAVSDMIGCTGSVTDCKESVLETLAIDEVVVISIAPAGAGQITVTVQRAGKRGAPREATVVADKAAPEPALAASVGALFGATRIVEPPPKTPAKEPPPKKVSAIEPPKVAPEPTAVVAPRPAPPPSVAAAPAEHASALADPEHSVDAPPGRRSRVGIVLVASGAALVVTGMVLWNRASNIEDEINRAPNRTPSDVDRLLDLEARGDRYALWGNVAFASGIVAAGVGGYLFWRSGRTSSTAHARVTPLVSGRGGGLAITWEVP